ncbi:MAG: pilus assembly protein PilX [Legionellaceae bacterium]|nr:pilus assembly protein PilX [Legionellaceae bacterium]HCA89059.1 pilus assembly protein PilX [Legionellales bacterium]|tara:strand:- start:2702 stop:3202 length:501 start_codon:yes stop_codon:yes gene_type:complete
MKKIHMPKHRGSTLIITLVLMLILTILAVRETSFNSMLTRVATNAGDALVSFETTEAALYQGVNQVISGKYNLNDFLANSRGFYTLKPNDAPLWTTINWASNAAIQAYQSSASVKAAYIIEQLPSVTPPGQAMSKPSFVYRVTARGVGVSGGAAILLQSTLVVPNN